MSSYIIIYEANILEFNDPYFSRLKDTREILEKEVFEGRKINLAKRFAFKFFSNFYNKSPLIVINLQRM